MFGFNKELKSLSDGARSHSGSIFEDDGEIIKLRQSSSGLTNYAQLEARVAINFDASIVSINHRTALLQCNVTRDAPLKSRPTDGVLFAGQTISYLLECGGYS